MTTEYKVIIGIGVATIIILIGGVSLFSKINPSNKLLGQSVQVSQGHVPDGSPVTYNSNPPAGGTHYAKTAHAGFYDKNNVPADGNLVHSLEHGAVILWYNPKKLSKEQINKLTSIFDQTADKSIMAPRSNMDVPVALSSWGQVLKLTTVDEKQIKAFFTTNMYRAPEQAPI